MKTITRFFCKCVICLIIYPLEILMDILQWALFWIRYVIDYVFAVLSNLINS